MEAIAIAFAAFEMTWLLSVPLWRSRLPAGRALAAAAVSWLVVATALAERGVFKWSPVAFPPWTLLAGAAFFAATFLAVVVSPAVRTASHAIGQRTFLAAQIFRGLVGAAFLSLASRSALAPTLGYGGGAGEIVVAVSALVLLAAQGRLDLDARRRWALVWNGVATVEFLGFLALWLLSVPSPWQRFAEGGMLGKLMTSPYALVGAFVVPVAALAHLAVFLRDERF